MKTKKTITSKAKRKTSKRPLVASRKVVLVRAKRPALKHFRLVENKHSFKLIHFRHTSHLALIGILLVVGFFVFASSSFVSSVTYGGSVSVGVIVPGPPPIIGAVITSPLDGENYTDKNTTEVSGTCAPETFVVVKDNALIAGSTACTTAGIFVLNIQLNTGNNALTALNYDNINQAGPSTPAVTVNVVKTVPIASDTFIPILPSNPSIIPGLSSNISNDCNNFNPGNLPTGGEPHVAVVCVPRLFTPKINQVLGVLVWGGEPPYALSINFSNNKDDVKLVSLSKPGYITQSFNYEFPGTYKINFRITDNKGESAIVQTAVQANGTPVSGAGSSTTDDSSNSNPVSRVAKEIINSSWFQSPVPFYLLAVAITLGFWGGDIFDRKWGSGKFNSRNRRAA